MWLDFNPDYDTTPLEPQVGSFQDIASCDKPNSPETMEEWDNLLEKTREKIQQEAASNLEIAKNNLQVFSDREKEVLRKIYCNSWDNNPELKDAIKLEKIKFINVPNLKIHVINVTDNPEKLYFYNSNWIELSESELDNIRDGLYEKELEHNKTFFTYENLWQLLKFPPRKDLLELSIIELYWGRFDDNNNIMLERWTLIKIWTDKYKEMMSEAIWEMGLITHYLTLDARERKSNAIFFNFDLL